MHRMLIIRTAGIGDVAMSVHAVRALRNAYPELAITVATKPRMIPFFEGVDNLDFIPVGKTSNLIREALQQKVDLVADLRNEPRGRIVRTVLKFHGAKSRHYHQHRIERHPLLRRKHKDIHPLRNNLLRFCDVFADLGYPVPHPLPVPHVHMQIPAAFGEKDGIWAGFAPFSSSAKKEYPIASCIELIKMLSQEYSRLFIFSGPGDELEFAKKMEHMFPNVIPVFGKTDIAGEVKLMSNLEVIITMDSSAMHMASLAGTPCVSLWGSTHPYMGYSSLGSSDMNHLQADFPCRPCSVYGEGQCRYGDTHCMSSIPPQLVMNRIKSLTR